MDCTYKFYIIYIELIQSNANKFSETFFEHLHKSNGSV